MASTLPPPEPAPPEFFLDRSLGRHDVASMFRSQSLTAHVMADVYADGSDQQIGDDDWIADIGVRGWIALTKDSNIARHHKQALTSSRLRVFAIDSANLTGQEMADRYRRHLPGILKLARQPGPYVRVIHKNDIELRWRPDSD